MPEAQEPGRFPQGQQPPEGADADAPEAAAPVAKVEWRRTKVRPLPSGSETGSSA